MSSDGSGAVADGSSVLEGRAVGDGALEASAVRRTVGDIAVAAGVRGSSATASVGREPVLPGTVGVSTGPDCVEQPAEATIRIISSAYKKVRFIPSPFRGACGLERRHS